MSTIEPHSRQKLQKRLINYYDVKILEENPL